MKEMTLVEVDSRIVIPFMWLDTTPGGTNLGRAEFQICLKFQDSKLYEYWVYPRQQRGVDTYWHIDCNDGKLFTINSYQNLDSPKVWMFGWCSDHETQTMFVYSPTDAKFLCLDSGGISFLRSNIHAS